MKATLFAKFEGSNLEEFWEERFNSPVMTSADVLMACVARRDKLIKGRGLTHQQKAFCAFIAREVENARKHEATSVRRPID